MFKFLKNKLKDAVSSFTEKVDEEGKEEIVEEVVEKPKEKKAPKEKPKEVKKEKPKGEKAPKKEEAKKEAPKKPIPAEPEKKPVEEAIKEKAEEEIEEPEEVTEEVKEIVEEKKGFFSRVFGKKEEPEEEEIEEAGEREEEVSEEKPEAEEKGFLEKITQKIVAKEIDDAQFEDLFWELEVGLLENNAAVEVIEKIKQDLRDTLVGKPIKRTQIMETITNALKKSVDELFVNSEIDFIKEIKKKKPYIICFVGINGSGKTTTIAKVAKMLQEEGLSVVMAAADTFRAAAIDQLETHADKLGVKMIKHDYGSDPAAVAYDAVKHAESKDIDVVLIDTAGRMHSNINLLDEMKKIMRVAKPDMKIFVGESITGNDCVEQAKKFDEVVELDGIVLSKADIDEKGGAALSVSYVTGKPILFIGTGQEYKDLKKFDKKIVMENLGL